MENDGNNDEKRRNGSGAGRRLARGKHQPAADRPYEVGKGKPPIEHRFKKGQPSPNPRGRPKGSTRANSLQKLLGTIVWVNAPDGRRVRKSLGEVIDHKLVEMAAKGDFKAIKLIKEIELQYRRLGLIDQPTAAGIKKQHQEEEEKRALVEKIRRDMIDMLEFTQRLKKLGILRFVDGPRPG
jgi:hypothetical protein